MRGTGRNGKRSQDTGGGGTSRSSFRHSRISSNSVSAVKMKNIIHEIKLKIAVYNRLLYMAREAILKA